MARRRHAFTDALESQAEERREVERVATRHAGTYRVTRKFPSAWGDDIPKGSEIVAEASPFGTPDFYFIRYVHDHAQRLLGSVSAQTLLYCCERID